MQLDRHTEPLQDAPGVALTLPATELGVFLLKLGRADAVVVVEIGLFVDRVLLKAALVEARVPHDDGLEHGVLVVETLVLFEHRHAALRIEHDRTRGRLQLAGEDLDEGGFPGAVGADDTVAVPGGKLQVHLGKQHGRPELHGEVVDSKHRRFLSQYRI